MEETQLLYNVKTIFKIEGLGWVMVLMFALISPKTFAALDMSEFQVLKDPKDLAASKGIEKDFKKAKKDQEKQEKKEHSIAKQIVSNIEKQNLNQEQKEFIQSIDEKSNNHLEKECKAGLDQFMAENQSAANNHNGQLYVFITLGMKVKNIHALLVEAKKYRAQLVIRGLKNDSFIETASFIREIAKKESEGVVIDPNLFRKYNIQTVPTFILTKDCGLFESSKCDSSYDQLEGNVSIKYALEKMQADGDLSTEAKELLFSQATSTGLEDPSMENPKVLK
jgi:conjugal transfer pilus assembly protein TrbC